MTQTTQSSLEDQADDEPTFLRPPSACGTEFEQVDWTGTISVHLRDNVYAGVRFNDPGMQEAVTHGLGDRVVEGLEPIPYYTLRIGTPGRRAKTPLHYLYIGTRPVVASRDLSRLVDGLAAHLSAETDLSPDGYLAYAAAVMTPRGMFLAPGELVTMAKAFDRVLRPAGFSIVDVPAVRLDLDRRQVIVAEPVVPVSVGAATLGALGPSVPEAKVAPGSYDLAGWLMGVGADEVGPLRPAKAVLYATRMLRTPFPHGAQAAVDGVSRMVSELQVEGVNWASDEELIQAVRDAGSTD